MSTSASGAPTDGGQNWPYAATSNAPWSAVSATDFDKIALWYALCAHCGVRRKRRRFQRVVASHWAEGYYYSISTETVVLGEPEP